MALRTINIAGKTASSAQITAALREGFILANSPAI